MLLPVVLAALAALPAVRAQFTSASSASATACATLYTIYPVPTGTAGVPTYYTFTTTTNTVQVTYTTRDTVTVTPDATTFTDIVTETSVVTTSVTSTPDATVIPTPANFIPMRAGEARSTGGVSRIKRLEIEARGASKRQTPDGNTAGYMAYPNGTYEGLLSRYPWRIDCTVTVSVLETVTTIEKGDTLTSVAPQATATQVATTTVETTTTVTVVAPTPTQYAACAANNVVNYITDVNGRALYFDRVIYRPNLGFPLANEIVVDSPTGVDCCAKCQETENCAGSFYAPGIEQCHLRLTQPYVPPTPPTIGNATVLPTATGAIVPISTGTPSNDTCTLGSLSLYLGVIQGSETFPPEFGFVISNGPCGRFSVDPVPIELGGTKAPLPAKRGIAAAKW